MESIKEKIFFPNLDGWRFVAFLAVFYHHSFATQFEHIKESPIYKFFKKTTTNGELGVDFFFVLSGFLIIYLLISEKKLSGKINVKNFYVRRILRIFPLFFFCVFFGFVIFPIIKNFLGNSPNENAHFFYYLFFLNNIDIVNNSALPDSSVLAILWSVGIEEQFYLTIPFLLLIIPVRYYKWVFIGVIILSWFFRAQHLEDEIYLKYHTFPSMGNLAIGGLIAYYSATSQRFVDFFQNLHPYIVKSFYVAMVLIFFFRAHIFAHTTLKIFDTSIIAAIFALIILEQNYLKNSMFKMSNNRLFSTLGKYTYGLYCLHTIGGLVTLQITSKLHINTELWQVMVTNTIIMFSLSIFLAYLSYHYYEKPFLRLKSKFSIITKN